MAPLLRAATNLLRKFQWVLGEWEAREGRGREQVQWSGWGLHRRHEEHSSKLHTPVPGSLTLGTFFSSVPQFLPLQNGVNDNASCIKLFQGQRELIHPKALRRVLINSDSHPRGGHHGCQRPRTIPWAWGGGTGTFVKCSSRFFYFEMLCNAFIICTLWDLWII